MTGCPDHPFDAVLVISFGGPQGMDDIRPFLANVLRGRRVPPHRVEEVAHHYEQFGGVSPLTEITLNQARGLEQRLAREDCALPVYVGMRNWHPYLADTLENMAKNGIRRAVGFITAAHHSYSSCTQYKENVRDARLELQRRGLPDIQVTYVPSWYDHARFIETNATHIREALEKLDSAARDDARLIFTAHSIPTPMAQACKYVEQLNASARAVASQLNRNDWTLVYQSRSGRPQDPWLEPDICDYLREEKSKGLKSAVICPIGFVCDHIEVLFDLDTEAREVCDEIGLPMARAETVNDDEMYIDMMADVVFELCRHHRHALPLPIVSERFVTPAD